MKWLGFGSYEDLMAAPDDLISEAIRWMNDIEEERFHEELRNL